MLWPTDDLVAALCNDGYFLNRRHHLEILVFLVLLQHRLNVRILVVDVAQAKHRQDCFRVSVYVVSPQC